MKKIFSLTFLVLIFAHAKAQYVTIPDPNFASFLTSKYPSAMSGSMMDTTNYLIVDETNLNCSSKSISNLFGIQFFDKLVSLQCESNLLVNLPALSDSLAFLNCMSNKITSLPALPSKLAFLQCDNNKLTSLPTLPITLQQLWCSLNNLTSLPSLPDGISELICSSNNLTSLPPLPVNLVYLHCRNDNLISLPALPKSLKWIFCQYNNLTSLPTLPNSLQRLYCGQNSLTSLPTFPNGLKEFDCRDNPNLYCLPSITQDNFDSFSVRKNTKISCLPKHFIVIKSNDSSDYLPVCTIKSGCAVMNTFVGNVHEDTSATCALDSINNGQLSTKIKLKKYKNGILDYQAYTNSYGHYNFDGAISDSIDVVVDTTGMSFGVSCPSLARRSVRVSLTDSIFYNQDFGVECKGVDLGVNSIYGTFRNGFTRPIIIKAGDLSRAFNLNCSKGASGMVTTTISGAAVYYAPLSGAITPSSVSGSTITYFITDFGAINLDSAFNIEVKTDTTAVLGSSICIKTIVSTTSSDINYANDTLTYCGLVVSSFDPNEKLVYPAETIGAGEWLTYTINFQNTGTDTAYQIIVRDTLDSYLDIGSFTYLASSHNPEINIAGNSVMFNFPHINLLDSFHNEPASHGWVQYKIKTLSSLPTFAKVSNKASIYFDDNDPIVTNTTSNTNTPLSINYSAQNADFKLYPNPASSEISIEASEIGEFRLYDLLGSEVYHSSLNKSNNTMNIRLPKLANGLYIYQFISNKGARETGKLYLQSK